jgi:hypothetical protein
MSPSVSNVARKVWRADGTILRGDFGKIVGLAEDVVAGREDIDKVRLPLPNFFGLGFLDLPLPC